jgi:hypothetical protein
MENPASDPPPMAIPDLEEDCLACRGEGSFRGRDGRVRCAVCDGSGYMPTAFGERIVTLMRHHFRPMLRDATDE